MKLFLGVTDNNWYNFLTTQYREDINFWQPGGNSNFKALSALEPFLFKLKSPINAIGGVGFFSSYTKLPISIAWDAFGKGNGCETFQQFQQMIFQYRNDKENKSPEIGCIVLTNPIFFRKEDWIAIPDDWNRNIVQGKSYSTDTAIGQALWTKTKLLIENHLSNSAILDTNELTAEEQAFYGSSILTKVRLGQGAFRILVTDAYNRKCAITGEKTLPVLEAAHIKPFGQCGPHLISNSLLLRSDLHKLFDSGYITITKDLKVEVSKRIKEEYQNGREYYKFHGNNIFNLPTKNSNKPETRFIEWHNENVFRD